jgi:photosystem II stability/assembly factor-like uncharacterized protein
MTACLLALAQAGAQQFKKVAPVPTGASLWGVSFPTPDIGWAVGTGHEALRTLDGGQTWAHVAIPGFGDDPLYKVTFLNTQLGFITGNSSLSSQDAYRTTDGGATWNPIAGFPVGGSWYYHDFVSSTVGFMGSNGALIRTTDGGASFQLRSAYPDCPIMYGMDFINENVGMAAGYQISSGKYGIFRTQNGGTNWTIVFEGACNDVVYLDSQTVIADFGTGFIRSTDGGSTWTATGALIATGLLDIARINSTTAAGVSGAGDIWLTSNSGTSWQMVHKGIGDLPANWSIEFSDALNGQVVGDGGAIFTSNDGGITWTNRNQGIARDWNAIAQFGNGKLLLAGHHGYVQTSDDLGSHWETKLLDPPTFGRDTAFQSVSVVGQQFAVAAGAWGGLYKTFDAGSNWISMSFALSPDYYPNGVWFNSQTDGWICGYDYTVGPKKYVMHTTDGGTTWNVVSAVNLPSIEINFQQNNGWLLPGGGSLYRTVDGGNSWTSVSLPLNSGSQPSCSDMAWSNGSVGYIVGRDGYVIRSTNGGSNWSQVLPTRQNFNYLGVASRGANEVWICGANSGGGQAEVRRSLDGGTSWTTFSLPGEFTTPYRIVLTSHYVLVAGYGGEVWRLPAVRRSGSPIRIR